jgi:phosphoglycolate phosphatase-like HAD superfamily hydrolase
MMTNSESKLILFDIDGTILSTKGIPRRAMKRVLERKFQYFSYDDNYNYSGRTDWQIVEHLLDYAKIEYPRDYESLKEIFIEFAEELRIELENGLTPHVYPGIIPLLKQLHYNNGFDLGLLTGNTAKGAELKLQAVNLYKYFPTGAFGDDAKNRNDLAGIAIKRATEYHGTHIQNENIWIIGDSIYDIHCAHENNLRSLAVCTGLTTREALEKENPDFIVDNLEDTEYILQIFLNGK